MRFMKDEYREFLLLPLEEYRERSFKELYVMSLLALPEREDLLSMVIAKNLSLIMRLGESSISVEILSKIYDFLIEAIIQNKTEDYDKALKSSFLEIIRHTFESYR